MLVLLAPPLGSSKIYGGAAMVGRKRNGPSGRRVALVTGANRGLGLETGRQLAARGYTVLLGSRDLAKGEAAAHGIEGDVHPIALDVADPEAPARVVRAAQAAHGRIDVLVNNAGVHYDTWEGVLDADWRIVREAFEVNLFGAWRLAQA